VFRFQEPVTGFVREGDTLRTVSTNRGRYAGGWFINAAGMYATEVAAFAGVEVCVCCDCHEAGITEPVQRFFTPMVVDIRREPGSANFYFYQSAEGQVIFCITPDPPTWGTDLRETSQFLPMVAKRMVQLYPRLANLKVRRTWRGCYPNSIDGLPYVDRTGATNHVVAVGMSGQGFMLGPGVGELVARMVTGALTTHDRDVLDPLRVQRGQSVHEALA
jgi:sarcosine oxidase subunit beta